MINREPTVIIGAIAEILRAIPPALVVFYVWNPINEQQMPTILLFVGLFIGLLEKLFIRSQVSPSQDIVTALAMPKGSSITDLKEEVAKQNEDK